MAHQNGRKLTPLESLIMDELWKASEATVKDVQDALHQQKPMAYNTVLTMMRILRDKGFLESERRGRSDVYRPAVSRAEVAQHTIRDVVDRLFSGSATALVSQLLDSNEIDQDEIRAIRKEIDRKLRE